MLRPYTVPAGLIQVQLDSPHGFRQGKLLQEAFKARLRAQIYRNIDLFDLFQGSNALEKVERSEVSFGVKVFFEVLDGLYDAYELEVVEVLRGNKESLNGAEGRFMGFENRERSVDVGEGEFVGEGDLNVVEKQRESLEGSQKGV